jgi:hypothetical protein
MDNRAMITEQRVVQSRTPTAGSADNLTPVIDRVGSSIRVARFFLDGQTNNTRFPKKTEFNIERSVTSECRPMPYKNL